MRRGGRGRALHAASIRDGWEFLLDHADETIGIESEPLRGDDDARRMRAPLRRHRDDGTVETSDAVIDHGFISWRLRYHELS